MCPLFLVPVAAAKNGILRRGDVDRQMLPVIRGLAREGCRSKGLLAGMPCDGGKWDLTGIMFPWKLLWIRQAGSYCRSLSATR